MSESPQPSVEERIGAILAPEAPTEPSTEPAEARGEPAEAVETVEQGEDSGEVVETVTAEEGQGEVAVTEAAEGDDGEDAEVLEIGTLSELAEHLNVEVSDLYENVTVPIQTPDGRVEVTIGEWKDAWQSNQEVTKTRSELQAQREAFEAEQASLQAQYHQSLSEAAGLADHIQASMLSPYESINWQALRENDPSEFAAKRQEMMEAQQRVVGVRQQVQAQIQEFQREFQAKQDSQKQELLAKERAALVAAVPEFADPERGPAEMAELRKYLQSAGFKDNEIAEAADHRLIVMARKARLYDESQKAVDATRKKVVKLAKKSVKPGARQSKAEQQHDQRRAVRAKLRKSGKVEDAAAAIRNLL